MDEVESKAVVGVISGVVLYLYNSISELTVILVILMLFDYVTGISIAFRNGCFHPSDGLWGAIKKSMYSIVIVCGFLADFIFNYMAGAVKLPIVSPGMVGVGVMLYLTANEGLSIFRNLINLGVPVPDFLLKVFGYLRDESGCVIKLPDLNCKPKSKKKVGGNNA